MGKGIRGYTINGLVLGPDFEAQRMKLLEACEAQGPGPLVILYFDTPSGPLSVHCTSVRVSETTLAGGIVYFSMTFCASSKPALDVKRDPASLDGSLLNDVMESVTHSI